MENYNAACPCVNEKCERHGHCAECREYHKGRSFCTINTEVQKFAIKVKNVIKPSGDNRN